MLIEPPVIFALLDIRLSHLIVPSASIVVFVLFSVNKFPLVLTDLLPLILIAPLALSVISSAIASIAERSCPFSFFINAVRLADVAYSPSFAVTAAEIEVLPGLISLMIFAVVE